MEKRRICPWVIGCSLLLAMACGSDKRIIEPAVDGGRTSASPTPGLTPGSGQMPAQAGGFACTDLKLGALCSSNGDCNQASGSTCNSFEMPARCRKGGPGTACPAMLDCGRNGNCVTAMENGIAVYGCLCTPASPTGGGGASGASGGSGGRAGGAGGASGGASGAAGTGGSSGFACAALRLGAACTGNADCNPAQGSTCNTFETPARCRKGGPGQACPADIQCGTGGSCTTLTDNGIALFGCECAPGGMGGSGGAPGGMGGRSGGAGAGGSGGTAGRGPDAGAGGGALACGQLKLGATCASNADCNQAQGSTCNTFETPARCRKGGLGAACPADIKCGTGGSCAVVNQGGMNVYGCECGDAPPPTGGRDGGVGPGTGGAAGTDAGRTPPPGCESWPPAYCQTTPQHYCCR